MSVTTWRRGCGGGGSRAERVGRLSDEEEVSVTCRCVSTDCPVSEEVTHVVHLLWKRRRRGARCGLRDVVLKRKASRERWG